MFGLYIHIPYCRSKCRYCDFYSTPCPDGVPEAYIDALCREMDRFSPCGSTPLRPDTLYFGGGTPSLLTPAQAARLIRAAGPAPGAEITLEAIDAMLANRATVQQRWVAVGGKAIGYSPISELKQWREYYREQLAAEQAQANRE